MVNAATKASVIISTYGRCECLRAALDSLLAQPPDEDEIVIIDQNERIDKNVLDMIEQNKERIRHVRVDYINGVRARNEGLKNASGNIIIFCDDDIIAGKDFIKNHVRNYSDSTVGGVAGRVITEIDTVVDKTNGVGRIRKWDGKVTSNFNADFKTEVEHAWGCNMSFRRELLIRVGGFDERLKGTQSFDDASICFAIRSLGYKIVFDPAACARHLLAPTGGCRDMVFSEKMFWYYHNFMIFYLKHMRKVFFPIFLARQISGVLRRSIILKDPKVLHCGMRGLIRGFSDFLDKR